MKAYPQDSDGRFMDLRDYFAAQAAQRLIDLVTNPKDVARNAYIIADAMMEARERNETTQT